MYKYGVCENVWGKKKTYLKMNSLGKFKSLSSYSKGTIFPSYFQGENVQAANISALPRGLFIVKASF